MCGIAGKTNLSGNHADAETVVGRMTQRLAHRGPDASGVSVHGGAVLGHRRLSIIDLSEKAAQPMATEDGRYAISYNGEVYNFMELKSELESGHNVQFFSHSDTEVILKSFAVHGTACLERFNGMFALAVWDRKERTLTLARDRFGKKPLYYYRFPDGDVSFASELSALLEDKAIPGKPSLEALNCYLALGYILSPLSFAEGVRKLEPGSFITFRNQNAPARPVRYWNFENAFRTKTKDSEQEIMNRIIQLLRESVRKRMISDVPVGAFLSGGIDSSSVVTLMKEFHKGELHTFSAGFESESYNELPDAERISAHIGTVHHSMICNKQGTAELIDMAVDAFDEPFADNSLVPMYEVSGLAAKHVKVALSGDGADEMFAGYVTYKADKYHLLSRPVPRFVMKFLAGALSAENKGKKLNWKYKQRQFVNGAMHDADKAHYMWRLYFSPEERTAILGSEYRELVYDTDPYKYFRKHYGNAEGMESLDRNLYVDCMTWLPDDILVKVDRSSMSHGLEARSPYLDPDLAAYAASIPCGLKMKGLETKYILKKALRSILPGYVLDKKKSGFNAPVGAWLGVNGMDEFRAFNKYVYDRKRDHAEETV